jgi:putative endopeptidase
MTSGIDLSNLDTTAVPGVDFYQYACGGWMKSHPLTAEYARFGSFDLLAENNRTQLNELIKGLAAQQNAEGSIEQKIGDLYNLAMDSVKLNKEGYEPIKADLARIAAVKNREEVFPLMVELSLSGSDGYFDAYIGADMMESQKNLFEISQGGLSLGEKEYYLDEDEATLNIRNKFKEHVVKMFQLVGFDEATAQKKMEAVMGLETRIAKASRSKVELRNPAENYHKMTIDEFMKEYAGINWKGFFQQIGVPSIQELSVAQPENLKEVIKIFNEASVEDEKAYMEWNLIDAAASYLSDEISQQNFEFYGRVLSGRQEQSPRWKRAVSSVNGLLGEAVGQMYVQKYFPPEAKERMVTLVKNLQVALKERIEAQTWMSDTTKAKAIEKLDAFYVKVGYPDKWKDYSKLSIKKDSYWGNIQRASVFSWNRMVEEKFNKPVDRDEWYMTPQTVNAYYNPTTNEICFPAGILQYPFFDMGADDAFNYGAIGVVIGHEMTHGFDDQGRQFDKDGNFANWWTDGDAENFKQRAQGMIDFFSNIDVLPDLKGNGALTVGENLADHGGLNIAFQAFKNATKDAPLGPVDGFTPEQRFFLAYANVWAGNVRDEEIRNRTKSDPHSLGRWRVNGALPHIDAWYEAFGITEKDPLFIPKDQRVNIW